MDEVVDQRFERKVNRHLEMMNHLPGMKVAWDNLVCVEISMFYARRLRDGVLNHFAERCWGTKTFSVLRMGYEIFSNRAKNKSYSTLVPRIKNDRLLTKAEFLTQ